MLTRDQNCILELLRESLKAGEKGSPVCGETAESVLQRNGILLTVYDRLPAARQMQLSGAYHAALKQAIIQEHEGDRVLRALSEAGLRCIALKGWELRKLYPEPTMRQMADLDILVQNYDYETVRAVMKRLGYKAGGETSWKHDSFTKDNVMVEVHKRLTDDSAEIRRWEKGLWERAEAVDGNIFRMSPEDYYIFHFVHLHKDFMNGSLGLRRIADTWLLEKQPVDREIVRARLEAFGMWKFHERMVKLGRVTMGDEPPDEDMELLLEHAFRYGIYGSDKSYKAGRIAAMGQSMRSGKLKSGLAAVFLPYGRMRAQFPALEKRPFLLPYYWIKRIVKFLSGDRKKHRSKLDYSSVSEADYREMKRFFEAGGVY